MSSTLTSISIQPPGVTDAADEQLERGVLGTSAIVFMVLAVAAPLAVVVALMPIALAFGAGAESRMSMGIAVIGGLVCGGALTLFVIPAMYVLMHHRRAPVAEPSAVAASA